MFDIFWMQNFLPSRQTEQRLVESWRTNGGPIEDDFKSLISDYESCEVCGKWTIHHDIWFHMLDYHTDNERKWYMRKHFDKVRIIG